MNVHQEKEFPFLVHETRFLQEALHMKIPVLGICLGAQMLAKTCGALVTKSPVKEQGWAFVSLTREGMQDPLFKGLEEELLVFQWHEDTFQIPEGGVLLATSKTCRNQAFRYGSAYGVQFHPEVTRKIILDWSGDSEANEREEIIRRFEEVKDRFFDQSLKLYFNFASLAGLCGEKESPLQRRGALTL
jgi:GMP synthase (glutamine-hydrolysing)